MCTNFFSMRWLLFYHVIRLGATLSLDTTPLAILSQLLVIQPKNPYLLKRYGTIPRAVREARLTSKVWHEWNNSFDKILNLKKMEDLRNRIDCLLSKDRASLSDFDIMVLKDCNELIELIEKTEDEELKKILLLDLTLKVLTFFGKKTIISQ